jgi:membrane associated rhomboid family serine protease
MLYFFGTPIENYFLAQKGTFGLFLYLIFYLTTIIIANLLTGIKNRNNPGYRSVGASGATSGILFIYILLDPWAMFLFPPLPAIILAIGYLAYSSWASKNSNDNIDHMAHYYGGVYGILFTFVFLPDTIRIFMDRIVNDFPL